MAGPDPNIDYYRALGVTEEATPDDIKRAYRALAKMFHPDTTGGDPEVVAKAKETRFKQISAAYEVLSDSEKRGTYDQLRQMHGHGRGSSGGAAGKADSPFDLGDLFSQFMGSDVSTPASRSSRAGYRRREARSTPAGVHRAAGQPLEVLVEASDGSHLSVDGLDLHSDVRVAFWRAILGTMAQVATIDGIAEIKIPPGTSSGRKLRLRGKGMIDAVGGGERGDHYVTVHLDVPDELDDETRAQIAKLGERLARAKGSKVK